ncbi:hypothetical protein K1Y38_24860 [Serratia marcescens]|uniref:hypothetical protein n=1 Tax=Serratia marcescens TaxID=615 RepID=UPI002238542B|nr:hypothetical protein [Serratia marcescens]MCW6015991.1 hypothetical protein [Serratia marcescens]MCW6023245.1 hypothetical protein [Serratia marcescens]
MAFNEIEFIESLNIYSEGGNDTGYIKLLNRPAKLFIFFKVRNHSGDYLTLTLQDYIYAIDTHKIKLVDFISDEKYSLTYLEENPYECNFIASSFFCRGGYNVIEIIRGSLEGCRQISVEIELDSGKGGGSTQLLQSEGNEQYAITLNDLIKF